MSKMPQRSRLGRGLNALISVSESHNEAVTPQPIISEVPASANQQMPVTIEASSTNMTPWRLVQTDEISVNPHQPRKVMDDVQLQELAASLKSSGLIQPIVVRVIDGKYQLIAGERRYRAAILAGLKEIPCIVKEVDSYMQAQMALIENIHRADLNPIERASAYSSLMTQLGLTQAELANRLGEQRSSIANYLRLLDLNSEVQILVSQGKLSLGHAKILASVPDQLQQMVLAEKCINHDLSVRNLERLIQEASPAENASIAAPKASNHLKDLETQFTRQIGLRVELRSGAKKGSGKLIIHYKSLDEFDELAKRIGVKTDE